MRAQHWVFAINHAPTLSPFEFSALRLYESLPTRLSDTRQCARIILDWPAKPPPVNTQLIYIYIYTRPFVGRKNTNKFPRGRWGKERMIVLRNQGDYLERAIHDARFLYSAWTQRERERERRGEKDKISMWEHPCMMTNVYVILSVIYRDCKSAR